MPTFAELRAKAEAAASTAKEKTQSFSQSSTKYAPARPSPSPATKPPSLSTTSIRPPPPPSRNVSSSSASSSTSRAVHVPAPPYQSTVRATPPPPSLPISSSRNPSWSTRATAQSRSEKPFSQYDADDKQNMFAALDLFFGSRIPTTATRAVEPSYRATSSPQPPSISNSPVAAPIPPSAPLSTRPQLPSSTSSYIQSRTSPGASYPPPEPYSSSALTISHYILSDSFTTPWFSNPSNPMPPPLQSRSDHQSSFSWQQRNSSKQFIGMSVFGDASVVWYRISWDVSLESNPSLLLERIQREARYRPRPSPWDGQKLYEAHSRYGPRLAEYARRAVEGGRPIGRGECWDLAHEGLAEISNASSHEKPFISIGRTHGQLLFWANAEDRENGKWYGGDLYVREGDVVEWRSVKIREVGMDRNSYSMLGDPDHTAIFVGTGTPSSLPEPSHSLSSPATYSPTSLESLTVVEQSLGQAPTQRTYDLSAFSTGEIWIYRPCGLQELLGVDKVDAVWPAEKGIESWQVGELE
ncbi:uncharacterized protein JCM6883_001245 [Sporobolomyces salmoneus]|uniref:uncharacterized protein n=1 Tax=Sporobolomyces salmoneus TaxID=183962 RepID=UPI00317DC082